MPTKKTSASTAKKKPAAKKGAARKPAAPATAPAATGNRLSEVARTIGSTVGDIVAKTKRALHREPGTET
ncbi:MAG: hypothetical protein ACHP7I_03975 [Terriglobales bacterium]